MQQFCSNYRNVSSKIKISGKVDTSKSGTYTITYQVTDKAGNRSDAMRKISVVDVTTSQTTTQKTTKKVQTTKTVRATTRRVTPARVTTPPTITLRGNSTITINQGASWHDPGFTARDAKGNDLTGRVNVSGYVNISVAGTYRISYSVSDNWGNKGYATRNVVVKSTYIKLQGISVAPNSASLSVGQSKNIIVYFNPTNATNKSISWSSSNPSVATVNNGMVTARSSGVTTITVRSAEGKSAYVSIVVK